MKDHHHQSNSRCKSEVKKNETEHRRAFNA
jgi:hypothetical protein